MKLRWTGLPEKIEGSRGSVKYNSCGRHSTGTRPAMAAGGLSGLAPVEPDTPRGEPPGREDEKEDGYITCMNDGEVSW